MKDKIFDLVRNAFRKVRPVVVLILVVLFLLYPYIPDVPYTKLGIGVTLGLTILLILFEFSKDLTERLDRIDSRFVEFSKDLTERLNRIDSRLAEQSPPTFSDFNEILPIVKNILKEKVLRNREVSIYILSVSGQFTWKLLIEDTMPELLKIVSKENKPKLNIEFVLVRPDVLGDWGQNLLKKRAEATLELEKDFRENYKSEFQEERINLNLYQYDNIPHWHAILVDDEDLFFGKCSWVGNGNSSLQVGQLQYKQFNKNDKFEGNIQIEWVKNWFEKYKERHLKPAQNPPLISSKSETSQTQP